MSRRQPYCRLPLTHTRRPFTCPVAVAWLAALALFVVGFAVGAASLPTS